MQLPKGKVLHNQLLRLPALLHLRLKDNQVLVEIAIVPLPVIELYNPNRESVRGIRFLQVVVIHQEQQFKANQAKQQ